LRFSLHYSYEFLPFNLLKLSFIPGGSIGQKSYIADQPRSSTLEGQRLKVKNYEITKPQIISWRNSHHGPGTRVVGLKRVRAAGAIARDDDYNERSTDDYTRTAGAGLSRRPDRALPRPTAGANARRIDLPTGSNSASTVDEQQ
jgi:hypothetical protein